jgi:hypothetical protein
MMDPGPVRVNDSVMVNEAEDVAWRVSWEDDKAAHTH